MTMTPVPDSSIIEGPNPPNVQNGTQFFVDLNAALGEVVGMSSDGDAIVIAGGSITITLGSHTVDTEGATAADDLTNIDTTGIPDGRELLIRGTDPSRVVTVKHAAGGSGQVLLSDSADYAFTAARQFLRLKLKNNIWEETARAMAGDLGTAAKANTGTASGNVPALGSKGLPAVSGEQLTDIPRFGNFAPSQQATPNMTLKIGAGSLQIGTALVAVAAQNTATITAPVTHPRNDIVHIDQATGAVDIAAGTEAASPADPAVPSGKLAIARLRLATTQTSIKSADFDDIRAAVSAGSGELLATIYMTASATYTKNPAASFVVVDVIAGGGAGGSTQTNGASNASAGGGGGGGGSARKRIDNTSLGATESVTVGDGGVPAAVGNNSGGNGGSSSFGSHVSATGGLGGGGGGTVASATASGAPGSPGAGSGGDINLTGTPGGWGITFPAVPSFPGNGGEGGSSIFGGGGVPPQKAAGNAGANPGAGGSGASNGNSESARQGGAGAKGIVIIREYR